MLSLALFKSLKYQKIKGFTLIELMITVLLIAIMVNMVVPLGYLAEQFKLDYYIQKLYSSINIARSEAIKRSETISICRSMTGVSCDSGVNWAAGWVVFENPNNNNTIDSGEEIIRVYSGVGSPVNISWTGGSRVTFIPRGSSVTPGSFKLCAVPSRKKPEKIVSISSAGLIRKLDGGNCP